ncbi:MAG: CHASE2 domain-containing protein [Synechococcus sp.]
MALPLRLPRPPRPSRRAGLALISTGIALWAGVSAGWPGPRLRVWERSLEQQLLLLRGPRRPPRQVVLVPVDDASLQQAAWFLEGGPGAAIPAWARGLNTLPWPRAAYGQLSERLLAAGARAVAINVVFEGPSGKGPADDAALAALLAPHRGRVALAAEMLEPEDSRGAGGLSLVMPEEQLRALSGSGRLGLTNTIAAVPGQPLRHPEAYSGGLLRQQGVVAPPSLATALLQQAGRRSRQPDARMGLNVYGPEGTFTRLPAWEVLDPERWQGHALRPALKDALVVVGPLEGGRHATPFGPISGLELLATATANSLQGDGLLDWPEHPLGRALLAMAPLALAAALALSRKGFNWRLSMVAAVLVLQAVAAVVALQGAHRWIPLLAPATGLVLLGVLYGGDAYLLEGRERKRLRRTFERYVAPSVVAEILSDPASAQGILRGRVVEVTVLFSDLKGFTQLTRSRTAAGNSELHVRQLNTYLGAMVEVITEHGGTIDKFMGDAVMAVFGSPLSRGPAQEAEAAVRCALAMERRLQELNATWLAEAEQQGEQEAMQPLANGVGLASGPVVAGQIGSPQRMEFTVIGDTVNLASRLEGLTRRVDTLVCMDAATARLVEGLEGVEVRHFGEQSVRGMEPQLLFGAFPVGVSDQESSV